MIRPDRLTLLISAFLVTAFTSFLLHCWVERKEDGPPHPVVRAGEPRRVGDAYAVPFKLRNEGTQTLELVQVQAKLGEEEGEQVVDFLAHGEEVEGAFLFSRNPAGADLKVRVASYKLP